MFRAILTAAAAYLIGSFSTGILVSRRSNVDIRSMGSKNTGASNVLRVMGLKSGALTFLGDSLKAALACLLGMWLLPRGAFGVPRLGVYIAGLFVIIGHDWPLYYGFRGGKGVACSVAVVLFASPLTGAVSLLVCLGLIALTKYISLGSLTLSALFFLLNLIFHFGNWPLIALSFLMAVLCFWRHRGNIGRLLAGTERKIGEKA